MDELSHLDKEMRRRGALGPDTTTRGALTRMLSALVEQDGSHGGTTSPEFRNLLEELVLTRSVGLSTAIMANAGQAAKPVASCTVLPVPIESGGSLDILRFFRSSKVAFEHGIGVGYDLSGLSRFDDHLDRMNEELEAIDRPLAENMQRPVAAMATMRVDHPQILSFIREASQTTGRRVMTSSVYVTERFFEAAAGVDDWNLHDQRGQMVATVSASRILREIAVATHSSGNPGVLFADRLERDNPTPSTPYVSTAPCAEVAMAFGDACHFGYVNLVSMVNASVFDWRRFRIAVRALTRALDAAVDLTLEAAGSLYPLVGQRRRIGVSVTGLSDCLSLIGLEYESRDAIGFAARISEELDYESKVQSVALARDRGAFPLFNVSRYRDAAWVRRKGEPRFVAAGRWDELYNELSRFGVRNASTTAMSSAETASSLLEVSTSLEPYMHAALERDGSGTAGDSRRVWARSSTSVSASSQLQMQSALQRFLDDAISKTVNIPADSSPMEVEKIFHDAYELGLRGVAVYRETDGR